MKKIHLIVLLFFTAILFSCQKQQDEITKPSEAALMQSNTAAQLITWDQLPDEFKKAVRIRNPKGNTIDPATTRSSSAIVDMYGPYGGSTGSSFSIIPPSDGDNIASIGIGTPADGSYISTLLIWYGQGDHVDFYYELGAPVDAGGYFYFYYFNSDEYISGASGRSSSLLNSLTLTTNKSSITVGGTGGTPFSTPVVPAGDWISGFGGRSDDTKIIQVSFDVYCKPWELLPGSSGRDIAVALDGTAYMTNTAGKIYRMAASGTPAWVQLTGSDGKSIAANAGRVCMVNTAGKIYELVGSSWKPLPGSDAVDITINSDKKIWMVNTAGKIYRYNDNSSSWELMAGTSGARIAAGYGMVWLINTSGNIYKWNGTSWGQWAGSNARDIAVGNDGSVWFTNTAGLIYSYNWSKSSWNELSGSYGAAIASNNKKACLVNTVGKIYKLTY